MNRRAVAVRRPKVVAWASAWALLAAGALAGCAGTGAAQQGPDGSDSRFVGGNGAAQTFAPPARKTVGAVAGKTLDGTDLKLADLKGKVVVVNFWASWCAPCRSEAPVLAKIYTESKAKGVEFVGVDMREASPESGKAFVRTFKIGYPNLFDGDGRITLAFSDTVPPNSIPSTLVLDRQGRVAARIIGESGYSKLNPVVSRIAAEK